LLSEQLTKIVVESIIINPDLKILFILGLLNIKQLKKIITLRRTELQLNCVLLRENSEKLSVSS
jgi:hypothetical protein